MSNFLEAQANAKKLTPQKVSKDLFNFIRTLENEMAQYNRARLNIDSEDIDGNPLGFYSKGTEVITEGRKKEGDPFTLFETGKFLPSVFAKVQNDSIFFGATDPKLNEIFKNLLTTNIFGLQDQDLNKILIEKVQPFLIRYYQKNLT